MPKRFCSRVTCCAATNYNDGLWQTRRWRARWSRYWLQFLMDRDNTVALLHAPARDGIQCGRAPDLSCAETKAGMMPWASYCIADKQTLSEWRAIMRSEEHTSELQSLMRTSYAVFCSKNK